MAASMDGSYDKWLEEKLISINPDVDTEVFVSYISGIVDSDSSQEDKTDSIVGILEGIIEENADIICGDIMKMWDERNEQSRLNEVEENLDAKLSKIMITESTEDRTRDTPTTMNAEELARKQAILSQYAHDDYIDENISGATDSSRVGGSDDIEKNVNSVSVSHVEKAKREKSKQDHLRKKEKDKSDREAQKQKQVDRKDAEKKRTQKGEKRR